MTHERMNSECEYCCRAKMKNRPARAEANRGPSLGPKPADFGDQVVADHIIQEGLSDIGMNEEPCAVIMKDRGSDYVDGFPLPDKSGEEAAKAFVEFAGPHDYIKHLYSDGSGELMKACEICN